MHHGLIELPIWGYVLVALGLTHITIAAVTIYLHRNQTHRALELGAWPAHFFRFWLWLTTGMKTKEWTAVHRKHHARVETEADPHSPQVEGIHKVLSQGAELYRLAARNADTVKNYGHGTPDDWLEHKVYSHENIGLSVMLAIDLLLFGAPGLTIWAIQMMWIPLLAAGVINGVGHYAGYRNYECADASTNIVPWGILIGGEELHNNHHAFASSAKFSSKWWEFDVGWLYIRLLSVLRLARVKKLAPKVCWRPEKLRVDLDTARAVVTNRLHVMSDYAHQVIAQVYDEEVQQTVGQTRTALKSIRRLLHREVSLLDDDARCKLETALQQNSALDIVYQYRLRLQSIWAERATSPENLLAALQDWCHQAEATGVEALAEFAASLRGYSLAAE